MARLVRALHITPHTSQVTEIAIKATPHACSVAVGGHFRFGAWVAVSDVLYLSAYPDGDARFMIDGHVVAGSALIMGAGSGRSSLAVPASIQIDEIRSRVRFGDFAEVESTLNAIAEPDAPNPYEPKYARSLAKPPRPEWRS